MKLYVLECCMVLFIFEIMQCVCGVEKKLGKSRRKRYIAFPEGSSFVATVCATVATVASNQIYFEGINWGTGWLLPNRSSVEGYVAENKHKRKRKQRSEAYSKVENILEAMGYHGPSCLFRALCEAPRKFTRKSSKLSEELLRIFFQFPLKDLSNDEPDYHHHYHEAHRKGRQGDEQQDCADMYPACSISLIDLALGYYDG